MKSVMCLCAFRILLHACTQCSPGTAYVPSWCGFEDEEEDPSLKEVFWESRSGHKGLLSALFGSPILLKALFRSPILCEDIVLGAPTVLKGFLLGALSLSKRLFVGSPILFKASFGFLLMKTNRDPFRG